MEKLLLILLLAVSGWSATTPITGIEVNPEGWNLHITVSNITAGGTFKIDHGPNHTHTANTPYLYVKRHGFSDIGQPTFIYDTIYIDTIIDKRTPNTGTDSTYADGSNLVVCAALSDFITDHDTVKSIVIPKGFYVNGTDTSAEYTATSVTNNSTAKYPVAFGCIEEPDRQIQRNSSFNVKVKAGSYYGRNGRSVRSVMIRAVDEHGNRDSVFVTATTPFKKLFAPPLYPKTDSTVTEYFIGTMDNTKFTQGDTLLIDAYVYPWVGTDDCILKTDDGKYDENSPNYHTLVFLCDKTGGYSKAVACVDTLNGNDATGVVVASDVFDKNNPPNKFKLMHAAINAIASYNNTNHGHNDAGGGLIYCYTDQVWTGGTVTTATTRNKGMLEIRPAPDTAFHKLKFKRQSGTKCPAFRYKITGMTFDTAIGAGYLNDHQFAWFDSCKFDVSVSVLFYGSHTNYLTNCFGKQIYRGLRPFGGSGTQWPIISNNYFYGFGEVCLYHNFSGNILDSCGVSFVDTALHSTRMKGTFFEGNKVFRNQTAGTLIKLYENQSDSSGRSISGNLFENSIYVNPKQCMIWIAADGTRQHLSNVVYDRNTAVGWRNNSFYNDQGDSAVYRTFIRRTNNIYEDDNIKTDDFGIGDANRIGNWSVLYGVGSSGNINAESEVGANGFLYRFTGSSSVQEPKASVVGDDSTYMKFVDRKAWNGLTTVSNVGGGDYHLQHNSPAVGLKKTLYYSYDITGKQQYIGDSSAAGAYEYGTPPQPTKPQSLIYDIQNAIQGFLRGIKRGLWR